MIPENLPVQSAALQGDEPATEAQNPQTLELDSLPTNALVLAMHTADQEAVVAVERVTSVLAVAIERVAERLQVGGRLFYLGAGTSGRLGLLDAAECPPTYNSPPEMVQGLIAGGEKALLYAVEGAEDDREQAEADLAQRGFAANDTLVGIAASGATPYVLAGVAYARSIGAWTIGLSCVPTSPLAAGSDLAISPHTGAEVVTGSTRMKAGTATKLVLNMLSTGVMVRLGYVYGNLMVNVQPTNAKLRDRAIRIVQKLTKLSKLDAGALLQEGESVRIAVIMHRLQIPKGEAAARLTAAKGILRAVIG